MSPAPALKRGDASRLVREALAAATCPMTALELIIATGADAKNVMTLLNKWTPKQVVIRTGTCGRHRVGNGYTYTLGPKQLRPMRFGQAAKIKTGKVRPAQDPRPASSPKAKPSPAAQPVPAPLEMAIAQAAPAAAGAHPAPPQKPRARRASTAARAARATATPPASRAETVDEFIRRGGRIQTLPGMQKDYRFAPRRPTSGQRGVHAQ